MVRDGAPRRANQSLELPGQPLAAARSGVSSRPGPLSSPFGQTDIDKVPCNTYDVHMKDLRFEWDEAKNRENIRKHGVSFDEAQTVFLDENAIRFFDPDHSQDEDRFIMLGLSFKLRVLVVCHCCREDDTVIRLISARKADKHEAKDYWH